VDLDPFAARWLLEDVPFGWLTSFGSWVHLLPCICDWDSHGGTLGCGCEWRSLLDGFGVEGADVSYSNLHTSGEMFAIALTMHGLVVATLIRYALTKRDSPPTKATSTNTSLFKTIVHSGHPVPILRSSRLLLPPQPGEEIPRARLLQAFILPYSQEPGEP